MVAVTRPKPVVQENAKVERLGRQSNGLVIKSYNLLTLIILDYLTSNES